MLEAEEAMAEANRMNHAASNPYLLHSTILLAITAQFQIAEGVIALEAVWAAYRFIDFVYLWVIGRSITRSDDDPGDVYALDWPYEVVKRQYPADCGLIFTSSVAEELYDPSQTECQIYQHRDP